MFPILTTIGPWPISSFGVFLVLALIGAIFFIWRLVRIQELDPEKSLDLIFIVCLLAFIASRLYTVLFNLNYFDSFWKVLLIYLYPGLSFWGAFFGGWLALRYFTRKSRRMFWEIADIAMIGLLVALAIGSLGCFFGGCQPGIVSGSPLSVKIVGLVGKRFPLQIVESLLYFGLFWYLWKQTFRFHFPGKVASVGLIVIGVIKLLLEPFRGDPQRILGVVPAGYIFSIILIGYGLSLFYGLSKRSVMYDIRNLGKLFVNRETQISFFNHIKKQWYNLKIDIRTTVGQKRKAILRKLNIRPNPPQL